MRAQVSQFMIVAIAIALISLGVYFYMDYYQDAWTSSAQNDILVSQAVLQGDVRDMIRECADQGVRQAFWGLSYDSRPLASKYVIGYETYIPFFEDHAEEWRIHRRMEGLIRERMHVCLRNTQTNGTYAQMRPSQIVVNVSNLHKGSIILIDLPVLTDDGAFVGKSTRFTSTVPVEMDKYWEATKVLTQLLQDDETEGYIVLPELCKQLEINGNVAIIPVQHQDGWWILRMIDYSTRNTKFLKSFIIQMYLYGVKEIAGRCYEI